VNDQVKIIGNGREHVLDLPEGIDLEGMQARIVGHTILVEPIGASPQRIPPGSYTRETLPPLSEGARKILASIDAVAPLVDVRSPPKAAGELDEEGLIEIEDDGIEAVVPTDEPLPGIDPDR
jgi:hypothetical protein